MHTLLGPLPVTLTLCERPWYVQYSPCMYSPPYVCTLIPRFSPTRMGHDLASVHMRWIHKLNPSAFTYSNGWRGWHRSHGQHTVIDADGVPVRRFLRRCNHVV
eukprot:362322-Chlamydomonas_euryale.AAC.18